MSNPQKVYVITSEGGPTKIGISREPALRCQSLQSEFRERRLSIAHILDVPGLKARAVERKAHELLKAVQVHGEWFDVDAEGAVEAINAAIDVVRAIPPANGLVNWHLGITIASSTKQFVEELADADRRSAATYVRLLIEQHMREKHDTSGTS